MEGQLLKKLEFKPTHELYISTTWGLIGEKKSFEQSMAGLISVEQAQKLFDMWFKENIEDAPTILLDELYWSFECDKAFKGRANRKAKLVCIEEIKP